MKARKLIVENFRCFKDRTSIALDDLSVIVGKNDVGKSSLLEALDIFFNDKDAVTPIESSDVNINSGKKEILIGVAFDGFPKELVLDADVPTTLEAEYLLNSDGQLEIHKTYSNGKLKGIALVAEHPNTATLNDLLSLKIEELRKRADDLGIAGDKYDARVSSSLRSAIRASAGKFEIVTTFLLVSDKDAKGSIKDIWSHLQQHLPLFALFQSDRKNEEKDSEIQMPMKLAIKRALRIEAIQGKLHAVKEEIEKITNDVGKRTLEKLSEINPEVARQLTSSFDEPSWDKAFSFTLKSDASIPLDKRGSGVRRLVLMNFFRAEAERKMDEQKTPGLIFAIEEPETSQHPDFQKKLIEAFLWISRLGRDQVLMTTHSPGIAGLLPPESLRLIKNNRGIIEILAESETVLSEIATTLGVLPDIVIPNVTNVRVAVCVEGKNDIDYLKNIGQVIPELRAIIDIEADDRVIILPMGGSTLKFWINNNYLAKLKLKQVHIYDSDIGSSEANKYRKFVDQINKAGNGALAFETVMRSFENYLHPDLIKAEYGCELATEGWNQIDVAEEIAKHVHNSSDSPKKWDEIEVESKKDKKGNVKNRLNGELSMQMTKEYLEELGVYEEVKNWFEQVAKHAK